MVQAFTEMLNRSVAESNIKAMRDLKPDLSNLGELATTHGWLDEHWLPQADPKKRKAGSFAASLDACDCAYAYQSVEHRAAPLVRHSAHASGEQLDGRQRGQASWSMQRSLAVVLGAVRHRASLYEQARGKTKGEVHHHGSMRWRLMGTV